jgi:N-hydroxyarylamine O-acetyltransferase
VLLDAEALQAKLVGSRRGGYCFEQNGLMLQVLSDLGFAVTPLAARVRWMLPEDAPRTPLSHMLLKVDLAEGPHIVDVGFGGQSPTAPLRLQHGLEQATRHGDYRFVAGPEGHDLQMRTPHGWSVMYRFAELAQSPRDYEVFNWFTSTHPQSRFVNNLIASRVDGGRRLNLFNNELTVREADGSSRRSWLADATAAHLALTGEFRIDIEAGEIARIWERLPKAETV